MSDNYFLVDAAGNATEVAGEVKVGRNSSNELVISDPLASRHHATVYMDGEVLMIRDEGSSNGTFVNGKQIYEPTALNDQDTIQFGDEEYTVRAPLWDAATLRVPNDGEPLGVEPESVPKKMAETSGGPQAEAPEVLEGDVMEPPKKDNKKLILIIAGVVVLLCFCCLVIAAIVFFTNRSNSPMMDLSTGLNQIETLSSLVLTL